MWSSTDSELERKKRKAKKALEDLAAAAGLLRGSVGGESSKSALKLEPVPVPPPPAIYDSTAGGSNNDEEDYTGKWRPMALKVKLGRTNDEPEVEESRMVYMREEKKAPPPPQMVPIEQEEELPPGSQIYRFQPLKCLKRIYNLLGEYKVSFQIKSFGLFGPGPRQAPPKPVSPPKTFDNRADQGHAQPEV